MNLKTLFNKTKDAIKYHLAQPTMLFTNRYGDNSVYEHVVKEDEIARPDLIALEYYGDQSKTDIILKWNGISDPFSMQPGDVLEIPSSGVPFHTLERPGITEDNPIKNQFLQDKRLPKKDDRRLDALKKKYNKEALLPPNVIPFGKKNYKFDKGQVIFGAQAQNAEVNDPVVNKILDDIIDTDATDFTPIEANRFSSGSGGGRGLTETQLDKLLDKGVGLGKTSSGAGAGTAGKGTTATNTGSGIQDGDSPENTNDASDIANDGAPCN